MIKKIRQMMEVIMSFSPIRKLIMFLLLFVMAFPAPCLAASTKLDRGVTYLTMTRENSQGRPVVINAVIADLNDNRVEPRLVMAEGSLGKTQTLSGMARDNYALAGINGGYFSTSKRAIPTDTFMLEGRIVSKGMRDPAAFGLLSNGQAFVDVFHPVTILTISKNFVQFNVEAVNHETGIGLIMYTPDYGTETGTFKTAMEYTVRPQNGRYYVEGLHHGNAPIPEDGYVLSFQGTTGNLANLEIGDEVSVATYYPSGYENIKAMLGCGPLLVRNGKAVKPDLTFLQPGLNSPQPRSAIGVTANNNLLMVTVDGRNAGGSAGMRFEELAALMKELGAVDAMALDGGGSTTLYAGGKVVNSPSGGSERRVANSILIISQIPVYIDGERQYFEVPPVNQEGRVLVPMRALFESLGAEVNWDDQTRTITAFKGATTVQMSPDTNLATINDQEITLDVKPVIIEGRTLVPLRFVSTALGADVGWDGAKETVTISTNSSINS
ncbi:MAG: phosphodiester glycosidase family protein [Syntrophomonadales bacterium]